MNGSTRKLSAESFYHYYSFGAERYIANLLLRVRREVYDIFMEEFAPSSAHSLLDVGVSADDHVSSNYLEKHYPHKNRITALSNVDVRELETQFPGLTFRLGDGGALPFEDGAFDFVFSHAVIEHVGSRAHQAQFVRELCRVAKQGVAFSTPNRWHPIESHTGLPFVHFLPPAIFRTMLRLLGKTMYATEEKLNLLSRADLMAVSEQGSRSNAGRISTRLASVKWLGLPSNFIIVIRKHGR